MLFAGRLTPARTRQFLDVTYALTARGLDIAARAEAAGDELVARQCEHSNALAADLVTKLGARVDEVEAEVAELERIMSAAGGTP